MALRRRKKNRELLVTKALLLGYTFHQLNTGKFMIRRPDGRPIYGYVHKEGRSHGPVFAEYPAIWSAARAALIHAGVIDAPAEPSRDRRVGSGKGYRLHQRR